MKKIQLLLLTLCALCAIGCGSSSSDTLLDGTADFPAGFVRFAHLSPDTSSLDIYVNGFLVSSGVTFETFSSYVAITPGTTRIQMTTAGTSTVILDSNIDVALDAYSTFAVTGLASNLTAQVLTDTVSNATDNSLLRVLHAAPDGPSVDLTLADGTVVASSLAFFGNSDYLSIAPGTYNFQIRLAGTTTVLRDFPGIELSAGQTLSAVLLGLVSDGTLDVNLVSDDSAAGSVSVDLAESTTDFRSAHLSPDAGTVDIRVDGTVIASGVTFPNVASYASTPTRDGVLVEVLTSGTSTVLLSDTYSLTADSAITIAATGTTSALDDNLALTVFTDDRTPVSDQAKVRAVHAASDVANVDVNVDGTLILASNASFPTAGAYVTADPVVNGTVNVLLAGTATNILAVSSQNFAVNTNYSVFVVGRDGDSSLTAVVSQDSP